MTARPPRPEPRWLDDDHVVVGDVPLQVVDWAAHFRGEPPHPLDLRKPRELLEAYADVLPPPAQPGAPGPVVVELGLHTSGSAAYLLAALPDATVVAVDAAARPVPELADLADRLGAGDRLHVLQPLDQADSSLGIRIDEATGGQLLDLVIDDASHRAGPTVATFEALFPRLAPAGRYLIEDWGQAVPWGHALVAALDGRGDHPAAEVEGGIVGLLATGARPMVRASLVPWLAAVLADAGRAEHALVQPWWHDLQARDDPTARALVEALGTPADEPPLTALAAQLVTAPLARPDLVAAVRSTPHWIEVRRGPAALDATAFSWSDVASGSLGAPEP